MPIYDLPEASDSEIRQPNASGIGFRTYQQPSYYSQVVALEADRRRAGRAGRLAEADSLRKMLAGFGAQVPPARQ